MRRLLSLMSAVLIALLLTGGAWARPKVTLGSKAFPESWILSEALKMLIDREGSAEAEHKYNLGGTEIVYQALRTGGIDVYPDYTGTVAEVMMKAKGRPTPQAMRDFLAKEGIGMTDSLGFNDGYALAVTAATQKKYGLQKISDLGQHPDLRLAFTHEFVGREDGWKGLSAFYSLKMDNVRGIQHELAYDALANGQADVTEIYTTDAQIQRLHLKALKDDKGFFPRYDAVLLYRLDLPKRAPGAFAAMSRLLGKINETQMIRANALMALEKKTRSQAATALLQDALPQAKGTASAAGEEPSRGADILHDTLRHLELVGLSLLAAILVGIPLGVVATRSPLLAGITLSGAGLLQTIPSLALLAFLIPFLGISIYTALLALFIYSLLPIVRNTYTGLTTLPPNLIEAGEALGLAPSAQLFRIKLPMASPAILAGIKTSAVINVGTAALAALIGQGGLGNPILQGIALRDTGLIMQGAIPAAILAVLVQGFFDLLDRIIIPQGLRLTRQTS